jgi:hypothetical protein
MSAGREMAFGQLGNPWRAWGNIHREQEAAIADDITTKLISQGLSFFDEDFKTLVFDEYFMRMKFCRHSANKLTLRPMFRSEFRFAIRPHFGNGPAPPWGSLLGKTGASEIVRVK